MAKGDWLIPLTKTYKGLVLLSGALLPSAGIGYLSRFTDPQLKFHSSITHEVAITAATLSLAFITWVAYQSYQKRGEPFLRFLTLAMLGFVLIYAPHGILTRRADHNLILFLIFGPASRLIASVYLLVGLLRFHRTPDAVAIRTQARQWWPYIFLFLALDVLLFALASSAVGLGSLHLRIIESISLAFFVSSILLILFRRIRMPLLRLHMIALLLFIQAAVAFLLARPWNHMWWLAHASSAAGFFTLGYEAIGAYETTDPLQETYGIAAKEKSRNLA